MNIKTCHLPFNKTPPATHVSKLQNLSVPTLSYDLRKVFNDQSKPHFVQDPTTLAYNLDYRLHDISHCKRFDFSKLAPFVKPSKDEKLRSSAAKHDCKFYASTSSITSILQILQLSWGTWLLNTNRFSERLQSHSRKFTSQFSKVHAIDLKYDSDHNVYGIDSGQSSSTTILSDVGHSLEKFLTSTPEEFSRHLSDESTLGHVKDSPNSNMVEDNDLSFHYSKLHGFLLRAQLDCIDPSLPKKTFDLKTRGTVALRFTQDLEYAKDYKIKSLKGYFESFEREDYDLLRSMLLKYGLQSRIGNMDGILVAYHNVYNIFGFQYFSQEKIDNWVYGNSDRAKVCFDLSLRILKWTLEQVIDKYPKENLRILYIKGSKPRQMRFVIVPEDADRTRCFTITCNQKKREKSVIHPLSEWKDMEDMSMDVSIKEDSRAEGMDIVKTFELHSIFDIKYPSIYFKSAYGSYLNEQLPKDDLETWRM